MKPSAEVPEPLGPPPPTVPGQELIAMPVCSPIHRCFPPKPDVCATCGRTDGSECLLRRRLEWEREHPRDERLVRAERAIVRALRDAGFGDQHQVTRQDRFEIAVDGLLILVCEEAT